MGALGLGEIEFHKRSTAIEWLLALAAFAQPDMATRLSTMIVIPTHSELSSRRVSVSHGDKERC